MMKVYINDLMKPYCEEKYEIPCEIEKFIKKEIRKSVGRSKRINDNIGQRIVVHEICRKHDILQNFASITEYEYQSNELYWSSNELLYQQEHCINILLDILICELKRKYKNEIFCIYVAIKEGKEGYVQAWFHLYRDDECLLWPCELNKFNNPALIAIV